MSTGVAARVAAVCVALIGLPAAHAGDRRKVAVVDLSGDPQATSLRRAFYDELQVHWALRALGDPALDMLLQDRIESEDAQPLADAKADLEAAEDALTQFDYKEAVARAEAGRAKLTGVTPAEMVAPYADLTLVLGQALLGVRKPDEAARAFELVHTLDPMRQLDPARYLPEIVDRFRQDMPKTETAKLQVMGKGRVWIDGVDRGTAPASFELPEGTHVVQLTGPDRITRGEEVDVPKHESVVIPDDDATAGQKIHRARLALANATDPAARAGAMQALAHLLDVHDAVLIDKRDGALEVQTWRDQAPGFSHLIAYHDQKPTDLLVPLAPAKPPDEPKITIPFNPPPLVDDTPWWRKRWVQASAGAVVVIGAVSAILWATRDHYLVTPMHVQNNPTDRGR
jgi:hypothetical protein